MMTKLPVKKASDFDDRTLPVFSELDEWMDRVRQRAYEMFAERGFQHGSDLDDWLAAERQLGWPTTELVESDDSFRVNVTLSGYEASKISVTVNPRELIIKASKDAEKKDSTSSPHVGRSDVRHSDVYSLTQFPTRVEVDSVTAQFEDGLLKITAPKATAKSDGEKQVDISVAAA